MDKKKIIYGLLLTILMIAGSAFAYFTPSIINGTIFTTSGTIDPDAFPDITLSQATSKVVIENGYPMTAAQAEESIDPYTFTITNNETTNKVKYEIVLETKSTNDIDNHLISTNIAGVLDECEESTPITDGYDEGYVLATGVLNPTGQTGSIQNYSIKIYVNENGTTSNVQNANWEGKITIRAAFVPDLAAKTLTKLGLTSKSGTPDFDAAATTDETADGLYSAPDDYGTSYYFRGDVTSNYVKFGKNASGQDMYWRIVRINGDGSIRMIYDGTQIWENFSADSNRAAMSNIAFNTNYKDAKFVGYMYGGADTGNSSTYYQADMTAANYANSNNAVYNETDSNIKHELDLWYEENIRDTGYSNYLSDEIFCNDRSKNPGDVGYGNIYGERTDYEPLNRINNHSPSLICPQKNDAFTVGTASNIGQDDASGYGNGYLKYPIGLITSDEAILAGGTGNTRCDNNYLFKAGLQYWTMSPAVYDTYSGVIYMDFSILTLDVPTNLNLVPVINIRSDVNVTGDGSADHPYEFSLN